MRHRAFTLIELLVVMATIAVIIALLMPSINRAVELSRRTVCAANLHQWGLACINYAGDNSGRYPTATVWAGWTHLNLIVEKGDVQYSAGTDYRVLRDAYGLGEKATRCPSSQRVKALEPIIANYPPPDNYRWNRSHTAMKQSYDPVTDDGRQYYLFDYAFIVNANNYIGGGKHPPARRASDPQIADRVLVADTVDWNGWANAWLYSTCHPAADGLVDWQNVAMADGALLSQSRAEFNHTIMTTAPTTDGSAKHGLAYWYWEGVD
ncbi:MAG: prepilin-type N-terminal cleavage/methylation domain-containing protein [Planctomycetes bacterium]|nr:prepilin-type N-terminal cleavage/methylation domain-containing protein [Planctomycetota bacterium]